MKKKINGYDLFMETSENIGKIFNKITPKIGGYDAVALGSIIGIILSYIFLTSKNTSTISFIIGFISMGMLSAIIVVYSADNYQYRNQLSAIIASFAMVNIMIGIIINRRRDDVTRGPALLYIYGGLLILGVLLFMTIFV